jgi:nucleotide-binding universal stress UspA family protein
VTSSDTAPFGKIVVGIDGSDSSLKALEWAARQAELTQSTLDAVTTWEWPKSYGWALPLPSEYNPKSDAQGLVDEAVARVRDMHPQVDVRTTVVEGHPAPVLIEASRAADLLVVGSRGHGEFAGMLLGSVSEHCVTNGHCPVVVVRNGR